MSRLYLALISLLLAHPLAAQGTVVLPDAPLDAHRTALREALLEFRDSLNSIDAAASRLQRDYREASTASLTSRARVMGEACARSTRNLPSTREAVRSADVGSDQLRHRRRAEMVGALDQLQKALARCESDFRDMSGSGKGERVRGYGNNRALLVQAAMRKYERVLGTFFSAMNIKVNPLGVQERPAAG
jgi:hypothetical protein